MNTIISSMRIATLLVLLIGTSIKLNAQNFDYGDVPIEQIEMTNYEYDSTAKAVILFDKGNSELRYDQDEGFQLVYTRHTRIKVLEDAGTSIANVAIPFRHEYPEQRIRNVKATSYSYALNGSITTQNLSRGETFKEEDTKNWSELKFSVPGVSKGTVFEYSYEMEMDFLFWYPTWYFQSDIPTVWSEYRTKVPEFYTFSYQPFGAHDLFIKESEKMTDRIRFNYEISSGTNRLGNSNMGRRVTEIVDFEAEKVYLVMKDVPALPDEPYMRAREDYEARVEFQFTHVQYPGQQRYSYTRSWSKLIEDLLDDSDFGKKLKTNNDFKTTNQLYTYGVDDEVERMKIIYNLVLEQIEWDGYYGVFLDKDVIKTYKEGRGSGSEINMTLIQMLRDADINAYPLLASTHDNGPVNTLLGVVDQFNHTLAYVDMGEQAFILDATDKNRSFNLLPDNVLGTTGLLVYLEQIIWMPINNTAQNASIKTVMINLTEKGYNGSLRAQTSGYYSANLRSTYNKQDSVGYFQELLFDSESFTQVSTVSGVLDDFEQGFNYLLEFKNEESVDGDFIYFNPMVIGQMTENPFKLEDRFFPVDYNYPFQEMVTMNISLPEGWTVDELPQPIIYRLPDNSAEYQRILQAGSGAIMMRYILKINKPQFMPNEYAGLKDLYDNLVKTHSENIVLKKAS